MIRRGLAPGGKSADGSGLRVLEVRGRKTGRLYQHPVAVAAVAGRRYIVSLWGESQWGAQPARRPHSAAAGRPPARAGRGARAGGRGGEGRRDARHLPPVPVLRTRLLQGRPETGDAGTGARVGRAVPGVQDRDHHRRSASGARSADKDPEPMTSSIRTPRARRPREPPHTATPTPSQPPRTIANEGPAPVGHVHQTWDATWLRAVALQFRPRLVEASISSVSIWTGKVNGRRIYISWAPLGSITAPGTTSTAQGLWPLAAQQHAAAR
jgi:hypothetical protein